MFRTSYVNHQEDYIRHAALYGMFFTYLCKQSNRLEDARRLSWMHEKQTI